MTLVNNLLVPKPYIVNDKCKKCGVCIKACPVKPPAVNWRESDKSIAPVYQYNKCIRCFCCQELCPEGAVKINQPLLRRIFRWK